MKTPRINLLPYRLEQKKNIRNRFLQFLGASLAIGTALIVLTHSFYSLQITTQDARNAVLKSEAEKLDKQIDKIKMLKEQIAAAVARKQVVESLQANRSRAVMILNQIAQPPANIYYKTVVQRGDAISITGIAPSNTSVSALIKQFETSDILYEPKLVETKTSTIDGNILVDFGINAKIVDLAKIAEDKRKKQGRLPPKPVEKPIESQAAPNVANNTQVTAIAPPQNTPTAAGRQAEQAQPLKPQPAQPHSDQNNTTATK